MNEDKMRKDFEAWARRSGRTEAQLHRGSGGDYTILGVHWEWMAWQAAAPAWQPIEKAPKSESTSFMVLRKSVAIQVSWFEGRLYPDAREACIDWEDGIIDATHWMPLPPAPEEKT